MKINDQIYYHKKVNGTWETFPGSILKVYKSGKVRIVYNGLVKDIIATVNKSNLEMQ